MVNFALFSTLILAAAVASGAEIANVRNEVRCQEIAFSESAEDRDIDAFRSFLDGDARFVGSTVARGPDEIVAAWQVFFSDSLVNLTEKSP